MVYNKKSICFLILLFCIYNIFSQSINDLVQYILSNNSEILAAQNNFDSAVLSFKTLDGAYSPQVSVSASTTLPDEYKWDTIPDSFSSSVTYSQLIPGGTTVGITGGASFNASSLEEYRFISQNQNISFSISQSLFPFWAQGQINNPVSLNAKLQKEYFYNQLLYTKKNVLQNLVQNYVYALNSKNQIEIHKNSIYLLNEEINATKEMKKNGASSQAQITQLQNTKWSLQQELMNAQASYNSYIQNIQNLCDVDLFSMDFVIEDALPADFDKIILSVTDNIADPLTKTYELKIDILKTNRVLEKQNTAPTLTLSVQPEWQMEIKKQDEWKDSWKSMNSPKNWTASIGINLSSMLEASINQNKKQYKMNLEQTEKAFKSYLQQKIFVFQQYELYLEQYKFQLAEISSLYSETKSELADLEFQYKAGAISKLDYESVKVRVDNCYLSLKNIEMYVWLYELLCKINKYK